MQQDLHTPATRTWRVMLGFLCACTLTLGSSGYSNAASEDHALSAPSQAAAQKEGSVNWYTVFDPSQIASVATDFEDKYKIHVNAIRATGGNLIQRFSSELKAGKVAADVFSISDPTYYSDRTKEGVFMKLDTDAFPNIKQWPASSVVAGTTATLSINPFIIAYNADKLGKKAAPQSWEDLLKPEFKGDIGSPDFSVAPTYVQFLEMWHGTLGDSYLRQFGQQKPQFYASSVPGNQALAAGSFTVFAPTMPVFALPLIKKGAPLKLVYVPTTTGNPIFAAASTGGPHPKAGQLFMNYLLSQDAQERLNKGIAATLLPHVEGALELPRGYQPPKVEAAAKDRDQLLKLVGINH
ncbi:hypothetical protein CDEF62S_00763 [Castellaniella defragrans]